MNGAFYIGAVGLNAQQRALDVVAQNITNMNTAGYKRSAVRFSELAMPTRDGGELPLRPAQRSDGLAGVSIHAVKRIWTPGDVRQTDNVMDLALDGDGFIELLGPAGRSLLWRGGTMKVSADGFLASADGMPLKAMISVPPGATDLKIGSDGIVSAQLSAGEGVKEIGRLDLVMVKNPDDLDEVGSGYFETTDAANIVNVDAGEDGAGLFVQGAIEQANVQLSDEMVTLLLLQRSYAADAQLVQVGDQLMSIVNSLRR